MGECIIARSSGGTSGSENMVATNLPVLNANYPVDGYFKYNVGITLSCMIDMYPINCTYQWYVDDVAIEGANSDTYTFNGTNEYKTHNIFCKVSNSLGSVYSRTANILEYPEKLYITYQTQIYFEFDDKLYGINEYARIMADTYTYSAELLPFSMYNNLSFNVDEEQTGTYILLQTNNYATGKIIGIFSPGSDKYTNVTKTYDISDITYDEILVINNSGSNNVFFKSIYFS